MKTRKPTGLPSWPILLDAGVEKSGKTYRAAEASSSDLVGMTYFVVVGEDDPDEYGAMPGARFEIVEHDGTYRSILRALTDASQAPKVDGKPTLLVLDSASRVWQLLSDQAQATANERAERKAAQGKGRAPGEDGADISMDLWNTATQRWHHTLDVLREHDGPVIVTARLDEVTVMDKQGRPTKDKTWKVQGQKGLPYDVGVVVQSRAFGESYLTGVKSLRLRRTPEELMKLPTGWSIDGIWRELGLADGEVGRRSHSPADGSQTPTDERLALLEQIGAAADRAGISRAKVAATWAENHGGQSIAEATDLGGLELLRDDLRALPEGSSQPKQEGGEQS